MQAGKKKSEMQLRIFFTNQKWLKEIRIYDGCDLRVCLCGCNFFKYF